MTALRISTVRFFAVGLLALAACSSGAAASPFEGDAEGGTGGAIAGAAGRAGSPGKAGRGGSAGSARVPSTDPELGGPCKTFADCNDQVPCTVDSCDLVESRCRRKPNDLACANGVTCDGVERCDPFLGCVAGVALACSDDDVCTIDSCDDAVGGCLHRPRDADGDGDPDGHCAGGSDCDDQDLQVSSLVPEICGNQRDDDCDGLVDEVDCIAPAHDTCLDPEILSLDVPTTMSLGGAKLDLGATCGLPAAGGARDVVAAYVVPAGPNVTVDVTVVFPAGSGAVALFRTCGDASSELACGTAFGVSQVGLVARVRAYDVPPGTYPIAIYADAAPTAQVTVALRTDLSKPTHETCGTAQPLAVGESAVATLVGVRIDHPSACGAGVGDLVYRLDLPEVSDLRVFSTAVDGKGVSIVSIRDGSCGTGQNGGSGGGPGGSGGATAKGGSGGKSGSAGSSAGTAAPPQERGCRAGESASAFARSVGPGPIYVVVSATAPTDVSVLAAVEPKTSPPDDERCATAPPFSPVLSLDVDLKDHADDVPTCLGGAADATYGFDLVAPSDVLLLERLPQGTQGAVSLSGAACTAASILSCRIGSSTFPPRAVLYAAPPGHYVAVAEATTETAVRLSLFVRPAVAPVFVPFADACEDVFTIPSSGGIFVGNTQNANAQYSAGCDQGDTGAFGAKEQLLRFVLTEKMRVVLDSAGSGYATLIDVRKGPACPGVEVVNGCTVSYDASRSFLDLLLEPGEYFIQVDGFNLASGEWRLDVRVANP